ncbi:DNA topoisomerase 3-alpha [Astathelohania contejeani]|uniref:DNA topoisomerase n=1 Tax=Astathelohania contejeani TaxID=164912 RepID=A0ABQ7HY60_9MICR|nr:DNA topoisomerase 3-alpha [Thelohania contejeani]
MKILNVAEKPSVAKSISYILSSSCRSSPGLHRYCPNIFFKARFQGRQADFVFTSVLGHIYEHNFVDQRRWDQVDPASLFEAPIRQQIPSDLRSVGLNITRQATGADMVIVWTDCDREGENIARQIAGLIPAGIAVHRARFAAISRGEIDRALNNLCEINECEADAVDARMELDLRIGSAFTRLQTLGLQGMQDGVVSYGSCQIPTLGFVVDRWKAKTEFLVEKFWSLKIEIKKKLDDTTDNLNTGEDVINIFTWKRKNIFDKNCVLHFYYFLIGNVAVITKYSQSPKTRYKPLPLRTVELQKICSSYYKMSPHRIMTVAESLYNKGYISYPRTETDCFSKDFDFKSILKTLSSENRSIIGSIASKLVNSYSRPRCGKNNDQAHQPIYPLKSGAGLNSEESQIYEFVTRRFLACLDQDARGVETHVELEISGESFELSGLTIVEKNYLLIYYYEKWEEQKVSEFRVGEQYKVLGVENEGVQNKSCILFVYEGKTSPPEYLTEAELINLMDRHGIGTDATIHEHIQKIQTRKYAIKKANRILPLDLGIFLIKAYEELGLELGKPLLRSKLEKDLKLICKGTVGKDEVIKKEICIYKKIYDILKNGFIEVAKNMLNKINIRNDDNNRTNNRNNDNNNRTNNRNNDNNRINDDNRNIINKINISNGKAKSNEKINKSKKCNCGVNAKISIVTKQGKNKGKEFYSCVNWPDGCDYFEWVGTDDEDTSVVKCECGYETKVMVAKTEANKGRRFLKCKKLYKPCNFFQWL